MRRNAPALLMILLLAAACGGEQAKTPVTKDFGRGDGGKGTKSITQDAARHAGVNTAMAKVGQKGFASIEVGQTVRGSITGTDEMDEEGYLSDTWVLELDATTQVEIVMRSTEVDAFLDIDEYLADLDYLEHITDDDDGAGGTDAMLALTLHPGVYAINASTYDAYETGSYTLSITGTAAGSAVTPAAATLEAGGTVRGALVSSDPTFTDQTHFQLVRYRGRAGERVTATLSSTDFDAYLMLGLGGGAYATLDILAQDDDGVAGTLDSRIVATLPEDGMYTWVVNTAVRGTGAYELRVTSTPADYSRFSAGSADPSGKYALIVGIDDYPGTGSDLNGPTRDADLVAQALIESYGFDPANVVVLKDSEATRPNIANGIVRHLGKAGPDGVAVFFYSGHGTRVGGNHGFLDDEADGQDDALYVYGAGENSSVILDEELGYLFSQVQGQTLILVDACHSGTISRAADVQAKRAEITDPDVEGSIRLPKTFITSELGSGYAFGSEMAAMSELFRRPERNVVLASSTEDQVSWTVGRWPDGSPPTSLFAYYLAKELRAADASTTFRDLWRRIDDQVDEHVRNSGGRLRDQDTQLLGPGLDRSVKAFLRAN